ncbi:MAG: hypothetical protein GTO45_01915 [Candidatus Aminicenantes bacterium]|nr:hypothetical protein [Candidatus Aminicenantes bacterium]NIM80328.1 hypothetical protein [Candidatus Aminicenantes bacterium]NIN16819.1 hypothetical protein [Candidatus Aminicenantes bacterium]NIN40675.1 hypothetical protein [Candidatus Aminicenantes bacterium]NIN83498.1 hypothetical protein [Candidatus Aminicenantes bacterium]
MKIKQKAENIFFFLVLMLVLVGISCDSGSSKVRKYKEKNPTVKPVTPTPATPRPTAPTGQQAGAHFQWETPEGWNENRAASGMRLAAFTIKSNNKESICTIIPLRGEAGGLKANVTRWLGQITTTMQLSSHTVETLLKSREKFLTKGQFPAVLIDYTPVTPLPSDKSILVSVITVNGNSIFIKMMGEKSHLMENKKKFKALCQSFTITSTSKPK